jgi:protein MpaA
MVRPKGRARRLSSALVMAMLAASLVALTSEPAEASSQCLRTVTLGTSVKGRPIVACERGNPKLRPLLFIGEIHGNEPAGRATADRLMSGAIPASVHLWVIRSMNPDGHAARTRKNARGVDLNRNFPFGWKPRTGTYAAGSRPASEPETRAVMAFIKQVRPHTTVIAHQPFNVVDISANGDARVSRRLAELMGMRASRLATSGVAGATTYSGVLTGWANAAIPASTAVTFEFSARPSTYRRTLLATSLLTLSKERALQRYRTRTAVTSSPPSVSAGTTFRIRGALSIEGRNGRYYRASARPVTLLKRSGSGPWTALWSGTTNAKGSVAPPVSLSAAACFAVAFGGDANYRSTISRPACVAVTP